MSKDKTLFEVYNINFGKIYFSTFSQAMDQVKLFKSSSSTKNFEVSIKEVHYLEPEWHDVHWRIQQAVEYNFDAWVPVRETLKAMFQDFNKLEEEAKDSGVDCEFEDFREYYLSKNS